MNSIQALHENIVRSVAASIGERWEFVVINYEMQYEEDGAVHDWMALMIAKALDGTLDKQQIRLDPTTIDLFRDLNDASLQVNNEHWGMCELTIDKSGKFNLKYSFDPPKRINGVFDDESTFRFSRILEDYKKGLT